MNAEARQSDIDIIDPYTGQPSRLPRELRDRIEERWGEPVLLYALADLDAGLRLARSWVVLGPAELAVVDETDSGLEWNTFARSRIRGVESRPGLSCRVMTLLAAPDAPPLAP